MRLRLKEIPQSAVREENVEKEITFTGNNARDSAFKIGSLTLPG